MTDVGQASSDFIYDFVNEEFVCNICKQVRVCEFVSDDPERLLAFASTCIEFQDKHKACVEARDRLCR